jgi:6-phosphofructokinase
VPSFRDRLLAAHYGIRAVDLIIEGQFGLAIGMLHDEIIVVPLHEAINAKPRCNNTIYSIINKISNW